MVKPMAKIEDYLKPSSAMLERQRLLVEHAREIMRGLSDNLSEDDANKVLTGSTFEDQIDDSSSAPSKLDL